MPTLRSLALVPPLTFVVRMKIRPSTSQQSLHSLPSLTGIAVRLGGEQLFPRVVSGAK